MNQVGKTLDNRGKDREMFKNYFKVAYRDIKNHKNYSLINIAGLALGMACCLLMLLYVSFELSYDTHIPNSDRVYRIVSEVEARGKTFQSASLPAIPPLEEEFPEVEKSCRLFTYSWREKALVTSRDKFFYEEQFFLAEPSITDVFGLQFKKGDPQTALSDTNSIVLSESAARRFFENDNPLGEVISVKNLGQSDFVITGVFKDMPSNSHFHCDFIAPLTSGEDLFWKGFLKRNSGYTYVLLDKGVSPSFFEGKLPDYFKKHLGENAQYYKLWLQPLTDIHLHSHLSAEIETNGDIRSIYVFSLLAFIILLVACFNYINLSTAHSATRAQEVSLRKVVGACRPALIRQFIGEAVVISFLSLPIAYFLVEALLPAFNSIIKRDLSLNLAENPGMILGAVLIALFVGLFSGSYPAFVLSAFQPITVLKGRFQSGSRKSFLRNTLVVVQYTISVVLIIGTLIVSGQMRHISKINLGFEKDNIVTIPFKDWESTKNYDLIKNAFVQSPNILGVTASMSLPSNSRIRHPYLYEGMEGEGEEIIWNAVDYDFLKTFGIELLTGRSFSTDFATDDKDAYLINETAVRELGWDSPLGKYIQLSNKGLKKKVFGQGKVIGVVKDFHSRPMYEKIEPMVINVYKEQFRQMAVRIKGGNIQETLRFMTAQWKKINPERPMEYSFFDEKVDLMYREDQRTGKILSYSTLLSILIACLGLFSLAAFSAAQRKKEIGIRKVLGASVQSIILLLSKDFARLILIANIFAWPVAYFICQGWIRKFAYRVPLSVWFFVLAAVSSLLIAFLTVGYQSLKTALSDPVKEIRDE